MNHDLSPPDYLLTDQVLVPSDAVAAILVLEDGRYVMQLRDTRPDIFFPGHWGCFGGGVEGGESPADAMKRELREELEFDALPQRPFTRFDFDFAPLGQPKVSRIYFEIEVSSSSFGQFVLHEGADFRAISGHELLSGLKVTPYDEFAIWMHMKRKISAGTLC